MLWLMFSAGGVLAALLLPILLLLFGFAFPLEWITPPTRDHLQAIVTFLDPLARVVLLLFCMLALFHAAHRLRFTLYDGLQIKHLNELIALCCYGGAIAGSIVAAYLLWTVA